MDLDKIESDLVAAIKSQDKIATETLRGLKTRLQNEKISKLREITEQEIVALVNSEVKRRKDAAELYRQGGREELASKEEAEIKVLEKYLPPQASRAEVEEKVDELLAAGSFSAADFGKLMGQLKSHFGQTADGALIAEILKSKLK